MTSSTSASERPPLAAAAIVVLCLAGVALAVLAWAPLPELDHAVGEATSELHGNSPEVVVLGNSVALASVDSRVVAEGAPELGNVALAAVSGGQPAHWLAVLRHRVHGAGHRPGRVVIYAPVHQFPEVALSHPRDQELLTSLVGMHGDEELFQAALGRSGPSLSGRLLARRVPVRDALLRAVSYAPVQLIYERPGGPPYVEAAMDELFGGQAANDPSLQGATGPGGVDPGDLARQEGSSSPPTAQQLDESLMPELIAEARVHGAELVVVVPARRSKGRSCQAGSESAAAQQWLVDRGVAVLDLEGAGLSGGAFEGTHHASERGRQEISALLARGLSQTQRSPTSSWRPGCD